MKFRGKFKGLYLGKTSEEFGRKQNGFCYKSSNITWGESAYAYAEEGIDIYFTLCYLQHFITLFDQSHRPSEEFAQKYLK